MDTIIFISIIGIILCSKCVLGDDKDMAMKMLKKYQYMGENHPDPEMRGDEMYEEALMNFQNFAGLNETGELNNETMTKLMSPRCGVPDVIDKGSMMRRKKRYALAGSKWVGTILYNFKSFTKTSNLGASQIKFEVKRAMDEWSKYADLKFKEITDTGDIEISFERRDHGDGYVLDGPGMTLAHAFFPSRGRLGGDLHFDDDETWATGGRNGIDLYYVSLHELGHSLGLQHSSVKEAVMYPFYPGYIRNLKLEPDDIDGIRAIYGSRRNVVPPTTTQPFVTSTLVPGTQVLRQQFCAAGTVDAIGTLNGKLFAFQGALYAELDSKGIKPGFPRTISDDWELLQSNLDAALGLKNPNDGSQMLLLFKDGQYWRYVWGSNGKPQLVDGYPREIRKDFIGGLPSSVDAAFAWSDNGRIYIVKGGQYYRIRNDIKISNDRLKAKCDRWYYEYPKNFKESWNVLGNVSDAMMYAGRTFFFVKDEYLRYNDNKYKPDEKSYDMKTASRWFGCRSPGSLEDPDMEIDLMKEHSQFDEIPASIVHSAAASCDTHRMFVMVFVCILFYMI